MEDVTKKDPFPNDWEEVSSMGDDEFLTPQFGEVMEDSMLWLLPDPYCCVVRCFDRKQNKLKEFAYRREAVAQTRIKELAEEGHELTVMTPAVIAVLNYPTDDTNSNKRRKRQRK